ncbi:MAG: response regulator, partial [Pseudomonadales bacterium]|nr:response regulator [Pseudomonadales bacterium]
LEGDPVRLGQVLINLVSNALKFTEAGTVRVSSAAEQISARSVRLRFEVSDTGIGIEHSQLENIFESFNQGSLRDDSTAGTGLGLTICRRLVNLMGGNISVVSQPGRGSTFSFVINLTRVQELPAEITQKLPPHVSDASLQNLEILLVEDNVINQNLAREVLTSAGMTVTVANNGKEALEYLENHSYFAVLMDLRMPVMDGLEAIRYIRRNPLLADLPVLALSAGVLEEEVNYALSQGFNDYFSKPVNFVDLINYLKHLAGADMSPIVVEADTAPDFEVNGIRLGHALRNHGNDENLLITLMREFGKFYGNADNTLLDYLRNHELKEAERLAHNIAGVSGSFGAMRLMEVSRVIEHRIAAGQEDLSKEANRFADELHNFLGVIRRYEAANTATDSAARSD